jgi:hypothetical protein
MGWSCIDKSIVNTRNDGIVPEGRSIKPGFISPIF